MIASDGYSRIMANKKARAGRAGNYSGFLARNSSFCMRLYSSMDMSTTFLPLARWITTVSPSLAARSANSVNSLIKVEDEVASI